MKIVVKKILRGPEKAEGKFGEFWRAIFIDEEGRLIKVSGEMAEGLSVGDELSGRLEEDPYVGKDGEEKMSYKLHKPKVEDEVALLREKIKELEDRLTALEIENGKGEPEIDEEEIPF